MLTGKKEKELQQLMVQFFEEVRKTLPQLSRMIDDYMSSDQQFKEDAYQVHLHEHEADIIRRKVMTMMYEGALLPFYREDYIMLLALGDEIANLAENVASNLVLTRPRIPDFLQLALKELVASTVDTFKPLGEMLEVYRDDIKKIPYLAKMVEEHETTVDRLQWELVKTVFKSDLELAEKLQLKTFIDLIAGISDQIEDTAERFEIILVKRPI